MGDIRENDIYEEEFFDYEEEEEKVLDVGVIKINGEVGKKFVFLLNRICLFVNSWIFFLLF